MKYVFIFILLIVIFSQGINASCSEGQIDINTATKEELDELYGVGPVKAEEIINSRTFDSVDELINVKGIGNITLNKIKEQGLACVNGKKDEVEKEPNEENLEKEVNKNNSFVEEDKPSEPENKIEFPVINLTPQSIKIEENKENTDKNYAMFGFIIFCALLVFLFTLRTFSSRDTKIHGIFSVLRKNKLENEFG